MNILARLGTIGAISALGFIGGAGAGTMPAYNVGQSAVETEVHFDDTVSAKKQGVRKESDGKYYYYIDGVKQKCGWATVDCKKYYFSKSTGAAMIGAVKIGNYYYVFSTNGVMKHDEFYKNSAGQMFYLLSNGRAAKGMYEYEVKGVKYTSYFNGDGTVVTGGVKKIDDDHWYYFKSNGCIATGGIFKGADGKYYYAYEDGTIKHNGWTTVGGRKYYFSKNNGGSLLGLKTVGGYLYYFGNNGVLRKDFYYKTDEGQQYYFKSNGRSVTGVVKYQVSNGSEYISYFSGDGELLTGLQQFNGDYYYFKENGIARTGERFNGDDGRYFYANEDGKLLRNSWQTLDSNIYYYGEDGGTLSGAQTVDGYTYIFNANGTYKTSCYVKLSDGSVYYLDENGHSITGIVAYETASGLKCISFFNGDGTLYTGGFMETEEGDKYFFKENGLARINERFMGEDGRYYCAGDDGKMLKNAWVDVGDITYYYGEDGASLTGIQTIDEHTFIFTASGSIRKSGVVKLTDGSTYYVDENGYVCTGLIEYINGSGVKCIAYFNGDGTLKTGCFYEEDNKLYYFKASGLAAMNSVFKNTEDSKYYYADENGIIARSGLTTVGEDIYYFDSVTGEASTGVKCVDSNYYVFASNGKAYRNCFRNVGTLKFHLDENGIAVAGFAEDGAYLRFYYNDGTFEASGLFTYEGKTYYASQTGLIVRSGYFKYDYTVQEEARYKLFYFDETTGEAITGFRVGRFMGTDGRGMFFDPEIEKGFRTGMQIIDEDTAYIFYENGVAARGFFCSDSDKKLYYCDEETCLLQNKQDLVFANVKLPILEDGSLDYKNAEAVGDDFGCKVLAVGFTQLFKPVNRVDNVPFGTPLEQIEGYTCTTFVVHSYYQAGVEIGFRDIAPICIEKGFEMNDEMAAPGDIIFWNLTDCDTKLDDDGDPWILDSNHDGICDRIHAENEFGDGRSYHVHHVSLALGNGQALETAAIRGVVIRNMNPSETYYPVAYGHWPGEQNPE
ncbi:MAG: hypothetical protein K6C35_09075 [Eubacterium sp.]|nr:hypothetical protein [Eubacterium sp.]